ncbi:MAG: hypothetical protein M3R63_08080 [Actinomycetota bacterium]|nr:hypothetical protein [Actinomycetota bacterium]
MSTGNVNAKGKVDPKVQVWLEVRRRHRLSHAHVQMAREIGLNPKKLGKIGNHDQEPWKLPLPEFIEQLYVTRFGRERPEVVISIEERVRRAGKKKAARTARRTLRAQATAGPQ